METDHLPSISVLFLPPTYTPPGINKLFLSTQALVFALNTLKQVNVPYCGHSYVWVHPPTDASLTLLFIPAHHTPLSSSLSPPSNPPTDKKFYTLLPPQLSCRPPTPFTSNTHFLQVSCHEFIL